MSTKPDPNADIRYLLDWASTGLLWFGVLVTIEAVQRGIEGRWVVMTITALFAAYVFLSSFLAKRRTDLYRQQAKNEPPRYVNFIHNPSFHVGTEGWTSKAKEDQ